MAPDNDFPIMSGKEVDFQTGLDVPKKKLTDGKFI
jgi:hypothetical protein